MAILSKEWFGNVGIKYTFLRIPANDLHYQMSILNNNKKKCRKKKMMTGDC